MSWTIFSSAFLTAAVEWVEAYTIVLAVSLTIGWRAALGPSSTIHIRSFSKDNDA